MTDNYPANNQAYSPHRLVGVYSIYDSKAGIYLQPWFCPNNAMAFRNVEKACKNPNSPFVDFPSDFTLFKIAEYCEASGDLKPLSAKESLGNLVQFQPAPDASQPPLPFVASDKAA